MIYLSIVVPSYNAEKYLDRCIPSLVVGGEDVEIIIVNDGSKDNTSKIAHGYAEKYPNVRVVDKENGGHGSGVNVGIKEAKGLYFRCVDADDWLDQDAFIKFLSIVKENYKKKIVPDLYLTNFVYNRLEEGTTELKDSSSLCENNKLVTWEDLNRPKFSNFFMMHSFIYKLDVLRESKVQLLEHTFYVDNMYVYEPLYYVKTLYFVPLPLYQYYVGHVGQSISLKNMAKNYAHDMRVYQKISLRYTLEDINKLGKRHRKYMLMMLIVNAALAEFYSVTAIKNGSKKALDEVYKVFKKENRPLFKKLNWGTIFILRNLLIRGPIRNFATRFGYGIVIKKTGWC